MAVPEHATAEHRFLSLDTVRAARAGVREILSDIDRDSLLSGNFDGIWMLLDLRGKVTILAEQLELLERELLEREPK